MPGLRREGRQRFRGLAEQHAAAGHDQRLAAARDGLRRTAQGDAVARRATDKPDPLLEQLRRVIVRLGLHILRQRQRHGAAVGW